MVTIFACPKSFGEPSTALIQSNAISSWTALDPSVEVVLFGAEDGVSKLAAELGIKHVHDIQTSERGTPILNGVFTRAQKEARFDTLAYVNADVILMGDFLDAVRRIASHPAFLMSGSRMDLGLDEPLDFGDPAWEEKLRRAAESEGSFSYWGNDYFVFNRWLFTDIPPLTLGRGHFDAWLFLEAERRGARIIDATQVVTAVHQRHDYGHIEDGRDPWESGEGKMNLQFIGGRRCWYIASATHDLTSSGERRVRGRKLYHWLEDTRPARWFIYRMGPFRRRFGLRREVLTRWRRSRRPTP